jgi:two-component system, response regulator YesN
MSAMWRAVIVDDEPVIRMGIKASLDWAGEGIEIAGEYANGAEALELLHREAVDILITDIKMPIMDGLELTRKALEACPLVKVVLISSHSDFEYVREGLKLGVVDYVLKHTLEPEELLLVIRKCKELLQEDRQEQHRRRGLSLDVQERERKRYEQELKRHLVQQTDRMAAGGYPDWLDNSYIAASMRLNGVRAIEEQQGYLYKSVLLDQLVGSLYEKRPQAIAAQTGENELFFLMPSDRIPEQELHRLRGFLEQQYGVSVTIGYARGTGISEIRERHGRSRIALERGFFEGAGIYADTGSQSPESGERDLLRVPAIEPGMGADRLHDVTAAWQARYAAGGIAPQSLKEEASRVLSVLFKHEVDPVLLVESFDRLFKSESLAELCSMLSEQFTELRKHRPAVSEASSSHNPIARAVDYIHAHYLDTLTLQQVAERVHVSKNYFSILFKKSTGHNFIDYVITLRVQKARELLSLTDLKVYEVAERSGFHDVKYFGKLFKKMTGYSPIEYRDNRLGQNKNASDKRG